MSNEDNHNDDGDVHDDDCVMTDLDMSATLTLTNKYNHSDCVGRIRNNGWERFEAALTPRAVKNVSKSSCRLFRESHRLAAIWEVG